MPTFREIIVDLTVVLAAALVLAALGPFGSYELGDYAARLAYWMPATLLGYAIFRPTGAAILWAADRFGFNRWAAMVAAVLIAAVPATTVIALLGGRRWDMLPDAEALFPLYLNVALVGALIMGVFLLLQPDETKRELPETSPPVATRPLFVERLSPGFALPLVALEMEDHYVRAHGKDGKSELILMRMRDAVAELDGLGGERVHRSWWVARDAVRGKRREGRNLILLIGDSLEAPVSRDRVADLKAAGWL